MTEQQQPDQERADALEDLHTAVAALREAWGWLGEQLVPGRESWPAPILTDAQRARIARTVREERLDRAGSKATGLGPLTERLNGIGAGALGASPAAARITVLDAAIEVRRRVVAIASAAAIGVYRERPGDAGWCDALAFLDGHSHWVATSRGVIGRVATSVVGDLPTWEIEDITEQLHKALDIAEVAAGVTGDDTSPFPLPCPACGRRSLQWQKPSLSDERTWSVVCIRDKCICAGTGCRCLHAVRYPGRRHAWSRGELNSTWGLRHALAMASRPQPRVRSGARGHGGWQERRIR